MPFPKSVSVLICTYNRARLLQQTLEALSAARSPDCDVDIVVIDNNSTDDTAAVISRAARQSRWPIHTALEPCQGKSFALNRGLALARGDILALTDDDVLPADDWLVRMVDRFRAPHTIFVFGKVLPRWEVPPPPELLTTVARDIWGPLALVDYGDEVVEYDAQSFGARRLPIGANLAIRRDAIDRVGGWRTDLGKVDNTLIAGEDHELCVRLYRAGLYSGIYDPAVAVHHFVPACRLRRSYFRQWFYWHGRTVARMDDAVYLEVDLTHVPRIARVPRFVYRELLQQFARWLGRAGRTDALALLVEELRVIEYLGILSEYWLRPRRAAPAPLTAGGTVAIQ